MTRGAFVLAAFACGAACTSFATVRSAQVQPGPSVGAQASVSTPPGDDAAWFWSFDCASQCDHPVIGGDLSASV